MGEFIYTALIVVGIYFVLKKPEVQEFVRQLTKEIMEKLFHDRS